MRTAALRCLLLPIVLSLAVLRAARAADDDGVLFQQHLDPYPIKITLPCEIAGKTYPFALSTVGGYNFFDNSLRELLSPQKAAPKDPADKDLFDGPAISVGNLKIPPRPTGLADLAKLNALALTRLQGSLGPICLQGRILSLDFDRESLEIRNNPGTIPPTMQHTPLGNTDYGFGAGIQVPWGGQILEFFLDTGNDGYIGLKHELFEELKASGYITRSTFSGIYQKAVDDDKSKVKWGTFTKGLMLDTLLQGKPVFDNGDYNMFGMDFLVTYNWIFDFQSGALYYERRKADPPIMVEATLGAMLERQDGQLMVLSTQSPGAAAFAGLKAGDQILRLGDLTAAQIDQRACYDFCLRYAGQTIDAEILHRGDTQPTTTHLMMPRHIYLFPKEK